MPEVLNYCFPKYLMSELVHLLVLPFLLPAVLPLPEASLQLILRQFDSLKFGLILLGWPEFNLIG